MSSENIHDAGHSCSEKCDENFISCVEHSRAGCLEDFKDCSSTCSR